jgi:hypothetical protein
MSVANEPISGLPPLSATLRQIQGDLGEQGEIHASSLLIALQRIHPEYGGGRWPELSEKGTPDQRTVTDWYQAAASHFDMGLMEVLDGRMLVAAIALEDSLLAPFLAERGFLLNLEREFDPPLEKIMQAQDYDQYRQIAGDSQPETDESQASVDEPAIVTDRVPTQGDHPAQQDQLGRRAFARALAHRLIRVRREDHWQTSEKPWFIASLWFLWNRCSRQIRRWQRRGNRALADHSGAFMLHIHGPWGSGKSSLLNFMKQELRSQSGEERWISVYFNAWRFQRLGPPWWALTRELSKQAIDDLLDPDESRSGAERSVDRRRAMVLRCNELWWRLLHGWGGVSILGGLILLVIAAVIAAVIGPENQTKLLGQSAGLMKDLGTVIAGLGGFLSVARFLLTGSGRGSDAMLEISGDPMDPLVKRFDDIIKYIGRPVVIFVDDLDRCEDEYVIQLLHGIQTMFWGTQAAYVVAADRDWLRAAYENHYQEFSDYVGEPGRPIGYLFLEKLFQLSTAIPLLSPDTMGPYWENLLGLEKPDLDELMEESRSSAKLAMAEMTTESSIMQATRPPAGDADNPLLAQALREEAVVRLASRELELSTEHSLLPFLPLLEPNPRAMKRMVNAYGVRRAIDLLRGGDVDREQLALWTIVEMRWPILADHLAKHPRDLDIILSGDVPGDREIAEEVESLLLSSEVRHVVAGVKQEPANPLTSEGIQACTGRTATQAEGLMV